MNRFALLLLAFSLSACSSDKNQAATELPIESGEAAVQQSSQQVSQQQEVSEPVATPASAAPEVDEKKQEAVAAFVAFGASKELAEQAYALGAVPHSGGFGSEVEVGDVLFVLTRGTTEGSLWGTDIYTFDSNLGMVAVHAGILAKDEVALLRVEVLPGQDTFEGANYNGVESQSYGAYGPAMMVAAIDEQSQEEADKLRAEKAEREAEQNKRRGALTKKIAELGAKPYSGLPAKDTLEPGQVFHFIMTGTTRGSSIWGSNPYTYDSDLVLAATHAGVLGIRERGIVKVEVLADQESYKGSISNGIKTTEYGSYGPAVQLSRVEY